MTPTLDVNPNLLYIGFLLDNYGPYLYALAVTYLLLKLTMVFARDKR